MPKAQSPLTAEQIQIVASIGGSAAGKYLIPVITGKGTDLAIVAINAAAQTWCGIDVYKAIVGRLKDKDMTLRNSAVKTLGVWANWRVPVAQEALIAAAKSGNATERVDALASSRPEIARVQTIPGIGPRTAEAFVVAIDQPQRFRTAKTLSAYLGLVPRVFQSGDTIRHGRITRAGNNHLRGLLVQAAWVAVKIDPYWQGVFERLHRGSKVRRRSAIVAVARRLGVLAWALMRHGTTYKQPTSPITANSEKV